MQTEGQLAKAIAKAVVEFGYEFIGIEVHLNNVCTVYIDLPEGGINIGQLEKTAKYINRVLAVEYPELTSYSLDVSSPGLDRPLFTLDHYSKYLGSKVKLKLSVPLNGRRKFVGIIKDVDNEYIKLEYENNILQISFSTIEKARLVPDIKF